MPVSGSEILLKSLKEQGVEYIFGYPGGALLPLYDHINRSGIKHILVRHEQGAAHAADGYARVTGRPGVCLATSGPGATNLVTGIATAYADSIPLVVLTGQVSLAGLGKASFQEVDIFNATLPITKHSYLAQHARDLPRIVEEAFHIACHGRPGPVLVDLPKNVLTEILEHFPDCGHGPHIRLPPVNIEGDLESVAALLQQAKRPLIWIGGGVICSGAREEVVELAERVQAPVASTLMGLGAIPGDHPLFLGLVGMHGMPSANYASMECDVLLAVGVRFSDRSTGITQRFAPRAKVVHIDISPAEIAKNVATQLAITGDAKAVLRELLVKLTITPRTTAWLDRIAAWKKEHPLTYDQAGEEIKPQAVIDALSEITEGKVIVVTDVGQHQMWTAQRYRFTTPRSFLTSGGLGTMGFGLPAAIGAQFAAPAKRVVLVTGDGSIHMNLQELATLRQYSVPVIIVLLNNRCLGMVRQWQQHFFDNRYNETIFDTQPDFVQLAGAFHLKGLRVTNPQEIKPVLREALATPEPVLIEFQVAQAENVYPLVPVGKSLDEMIGGCM